MPDVQHLEIELQELATRYKDVPLLIKDGLEQLIDACGHYIPPGGEP